MLETADPQETSSNLDKQIYNSMSILVSVYFNHILGTDWCIIFSFSKIDIAMDQKSKLDPYRQTSGVLSSNVFISADISSTAK